MHTMIHHVVGLGEVGGAILCNLKDAGYTVDGSDISDYAGPKVMSGYRHCTSPICMHVCIPFSHQDFGDWVGAWAQTIGERLSLVVIHATVPPGTTQTLSKHIEARGLPRGIPVVHSPVNGKHKSTGSMEVYIKSLPKFFGGHQKDKGLVEREFREVWDVCWLGDARITETMKLLATTYYGLLINWTQFVHKICKAIDMPYEKVMSVFTMIDSEDWRIDNKYPGKWGGHCIEPNFELLYSIFPHSLLEAMAELNEEFRA